MTEHHTDRCNLTVNGQEFELAHADHLARHVAAIQHTGFTEVWLRRHDETFSMLTNREHQRAFLIVMTDENEAGFHATSQGEMEPDQLFEFVLDNGQMDEWDSSDTVSLPEGLRALAHFLAHGGMASGIDWHDDSQQGI